MSVQKTPEADVRRRRPLYAEVGMIVALVAVIAAFTVPTPPAEAASFAEGPDDVFEPLFAMFVFAVLLVPGLLIPRFYYRLVKSGLVTVIREGVSVYMFADRQRLAKANEMLRTISSYRERRVARLHAR